MHEPSLAFRPRVAPGLVTHELGDDVLITGGPNGPLALTGPDAIVWHLLARGERLDAIATDLVTESGVPGAIIEGRLLGLVEQLGARGLLDGVAPDPAARTIVAERIVLPEIEQELPDAELTVYGEAGVRVRELRGRRTVLVHWDPGCAHCAEADDGIRRRLGELDAAGITLVRVDGRDTDTFRFTGTPTAFLIDGDGRLERPMAAGTRELFALLDELCGTPRAPGAAPPGVDYLPAPPAMCLPGDPLPVRRAEWAGTRSYRFGGCHVGIRVDAEATGAILDRLFPGARVDDPRVPVNYAVELHPDDADDADDASPANVLVRGGSELVRSRSGARVLAALLAHLTDDLAIVEPGLCPLGAAVLVRDGHAVIVPWATRHWSYAVEPLLARHGYGFADGPLLGVDLDEGVVVIPAPSVPFDQSVLAALDASCALGAEQPRVRPGRYPITAWCHFDRAGRTGELPIATAVAEALPSIAWAGDTAALVERLASCLERVPSLAMAYADEREFVECVAGL